MGYEQGVVGHLAHFPVHCGVVALILGFWLARICRCAAIPTLILGVGFLIQAGLLWRPPHEAAVKSESPPVRLLSFNVYQGNRQFDRVIAAIRKTNPDVIYLTELTPEWRQAIAPLHSEWTYSLGTGANLLLSRFPLDHARSVVVTFERAKTANSSASDSPLVLTEAERRVWPNTEILFATARVGERRLNLAGLHLPTPRSRVSLLAQRAAGLVVAQELADVYGAQSVVLLGDLNTSSFSPTFRFLTACTTLRDSAQGWGYSPTWGPRLPKEPLLPWLGTAIDHLLVSNNITVVKRETGPALGSDHRWVSADIIW